MNCKQCGTIIPQDAAFCPECGTPVSTTGLNAGPPYITTADQPQNVAYKSSAFAPIEHMKFFNFFSNFINALEHSDFFKKPLYWLYTLFAVLNIIVPVYFLFMLISNDLLNLFGVGSLLIWLVVAFAGWMGFQLWWNRKEKIGLYFKKGDDFYAIPLFSHYIQTTGEWLGMTIAIVGTGTSLIAWLFLSGNNNGGGFPIPMKSFGIAGIVVSPIIGFIILLITKVLAELYRALAAIANNTKQMTLKN